MRRLWAAGAAIVVCLALGVMPVGAQEATTQPGPVTVGVAHACQLTTGYSITYEDGVELLRDGVISCDVTADDARLTGPLTVAIDCDCTVVGCACWGVARTNGAGPGLAGPPGKAWVGYLWTCRLTTILASFNWRLRVAGAMPCA